MLLGIRSLRKLLLSIDSSLIRYSTRYTEIVIIKRIGGIGKSEIEVVN
jgi:hypothetical protein